MKITPEELAQNGYVLIDKLEHNELIPFVQFYLKKNTLSSYTYTFSNLLIVGIIFYWLWQNYGTPDFAVGKGVGYLAFGFSLAFFLIPLHEYIHVLAYKSQGAIHTSYDANLKKFYFLAVADKFIVNRKEFQVVALAPFVVISSSLIILLFFVPKMWTFMILGMLLTHTAFTSGDFGLLSYFDYHKNREIVTYDDKENKISYFYVKE
jgi:hypothetical protein